MNKWKGRMKTWAMRREKEISRQKSRGRTGIRKECSLLRVQLKWENRVVGTQKKRLRAKNLESTRNSEEVSRSIVRLSGEWERKWVEGGKTQDCRERGQSSSWPPILWPAVLSCWRPLPERMVNDASSSKKRIIEGLIPRSSDQYFPLCFVVCLK